MSSWLDLLGKIAPAILSLAAAKLIIGRRAKHIDIFDRTAKEVAVRDAILKLKLKAAEPNDKTQSKRIAARKQAYDQAEILEGRLDKEIAALVPKVRPDVAWMGNSSYRQKFIPLPPYEGKKGLSSWRRAGWWLLFVAFYVGLAVYVFFGYELVRFFLEAAHTQLLSKNVRLYFGELFLIVLFFCFFLVAGAAARRAAYRVALRL